MNNQHSLVRPVRQTIVFCRLSICQLAVRVDFSNSSAEKPCGAVLPGCSRLSAALYTHVGRTPSSAQRPPGRLLATGEFLERLQPPFRRPFGLSSPRTTGLGCFRPARRAPHPPHTLYSNIVAVLLRSHSLMSFKIFQRVSQAPTKPQAAPAPQAIRRRRSLQRTRADRQRTGSRRVARPRRKTAPGLLLDRQQRDHQPVLRHRVSGRTRPILRPRRPALLRHPALRPKLFELRPAAAAQLRGAAQVPLRRRPGTRQDRQRGPHGRARPAIRCAKCSARSRKDSRR